MTSKVFLSYSREDIIQVKQMYRYLSDAGCDVWMDVEKLLPGQDWELEIETAIEQSNYFIACLSSHSVNKIGYVQAEMKKALNHLLRFPEGQIYLIPIRLDDCPIPRSLASKNCIDWHNIEQRAKLLDVLEAI